MIDKRSVDVFLSRMIYHHNHHHHFFIINDSSSSSSSQSGASILWFWSHPRLSELCLKRKYQYRNKLFSTIQRILNVLFTFHLSLNINTYSIYENIHVGKYFSFWDLTCFAGFPYESHLYSTSVSYHILILYIVFCIQHVNLIPRSYILWPCPKSYVICHRTYKYIISYIL